MVKQHVNTIVDFISAYRKNPNFSSVSVVGNPQNKDETFIIIDFDKEKNDFEKGFFRLRTPYNLSNPLHKRVLDLAIRSADSKYEQEPIKLK